MIMTERDYRLKWSPDKKTGGVEYVPMGIESMLPVWTEEAMLAWVGSVAGECYGSSMDRERCINRAIQCVMRGHHSPWEHFNVSLRCVMDRGTSHALVRHRHCAFQQSSTIYQNYSRDGHIKVVALPDIDPCTGKEVQRMPESELQTYETAAAQYMELLGTGDAPGRARDVLPNALATTLIITAGIREWMYIIQRRQGAGDAVRMHVFAWQALGWFEKNYPRTTNAFMQWYDEGHGI